MDIIDEAASQKGDGDKSLQLENETPAASSSTTTPQFSRPAYVQDFDDVAGQTVRGTRRVASITDKSKTMKMKAGAERPNRSAKKMTSQKPEPPITGRALFDQEGKPTRSTVLEYYGVASEELPARLNAPRPPSQSYPWSTAFDSTPPNRPPFSRPTFYQPSGHTQNLPPSFSNTHNYFTPHPVTSRESYGRFPVSEKATNIYGVKAVNLESLNEDVMAKPTSTIDSLDLFPPSKHKHDPLSLGKYEDRNEDLYVPILDPYGSGPSGFASGSRKIVPRSKTRRDEEADRMNMPPPPRPVRPEVLSRKRSDYSVPHPDGLHRTYHDDQQSDSRISRRASPRRRQVSYYPEDGLQLPTYNVNKRRPSSHNFRSRTKDDIQNQKLRLASTYQDDINPHQVPLTTESLKKSQRRQSRTYSTVAQNGSEDEDKDGSNVTIRINGDARVVVGGAQIACQDGGEINISRRKSIRNRYERSDSEYGWREASYTDTYDGEKRRARRITRKPPLISTMEQKMESLDTDRGVIITQEATREHIFSDSETTSDNKRVDQEIQTSVTEHAGQDEDYAFDLFIEPAASRVADTTAGSQRSKMKTDRLNHQTMKQVLRKSRERQVQAAAQTLPPLKRGDIILDMEDSSRSSSRETFLRQQQVLDSSTESGASNIMTRSENETLERRDVPTYVADHIEDLSPSIHMYTTSQQGNSTADPSEVSLSEATGVIETGTLSEAALELETNKNDTEASVAEHYESFTEAKPNIEADLRFSSDHISLVEEANIKQEQPEDENRTLAEGDGSDAGLGSNSNILPFPSSYEDVATEEGSSFNLYEQAINWEDDDISDTQSLASIADSVFSYVSGSSMSSVSGPVGAGERFVALLLGDNTIQDLCNEGLATIASGRFERNFRRMLKEFAVNLRQEAGNIQQRNAAHFVRFRARNSAHIVCSRVGKGDRVIAKKSVQETPHDDGEVEVVESDESSSNESDTELNDLQHLELFIKNSEALNLLREKLQNFVHPQQPAVVVGKTTIKERCKCGHVIVDEFIEVRPGGLDRYREAFYPKISKSVGCRKSKAFTLNRYQDNAKLDRTSTNSSMAKTLTGSIRSLRSIFSFRSKGSAGIEDGLPLHFLPSNPALESNAQPTTPPPLPEDLLFLLLCFSEGRYATRLLQLDLVSLNATSDNVLFNLLRANYNAMRPRFTSFFSLRTLQWIKFVHFETYGSEFVDVRKVNDIPPPEHVEYKYAPAPPDVIPPVGERHMMHLFKNPQCAVDETLCLSRFPKKLKEKLKCQGGNPGWGLQFVEGWDFKKIWIVAFLLFGLGSLVLGIVWAVYQHSIQDAFAIASFMMTFATLSVGLMQALLVM